MLDMDKIFEIVNYLYENRAGHNTDAWRSINDSFNQTTGISTSEFKEALLSYLKKRRGNQRKIDRVVNFQAKYRTLFGWDENVDNTLNALGYLGQRSNHYTDYLFKKITSDSKEGKLATSEKFFLSRCITLAAQINPRATEYFRKLVYTNTVASITSDDDYLQIARSTSVQRGIDAGIRRFDIASPKVILFLLEKLAKLDYSPIDMYKLLNRVLGETPNVRCKIVDTEGNYSYLQRNFSKEAIKYIKMNPPWEMTLPYYSWLKLWCKNDHSFMNKIEEIAHGKDLAISYLIRFLKMRERYLKRNTTEPDRENRLHFLEDSINCLSSKIAKERMGEFKLWENAFHPSSNRYTLANMAFDYIMYETRILWQLISPNQ